MKAPRKKKKQKRRRPLESVPLGKLMADVEKELRVKYGESDKTRRD